MGVTDDPTISRITIIVDSGNSVVEQVEKQLNKLIEVIKVRTLEENALIGRELMLLKVNANNKTRQDIMTICEIMGAKVTDISPTSLTLELSDTPERLDTFQSMMRPFSILEVARTGMVAVQKLSLIHISWYHLTSQAVCLCAHAPITVGIRPLLLREDPRSEKRLAGELQDVYKRQRWLSSSSTRLAEPTMWWSVRCV